MRLATFNVENLFLRARALNQDTWRDGAPIVEAQAKLNRILGKSRYSEADSCRIVALLKELGIEKRDDGGHFAVLRPIRGKLLQRAKSGSVQVIANGRADWIGWVELKTELVNEVATRMTAKVIADLDADVQAVVEAESRPALLRLSEVLLPAVGTRPFDQVMVIDGNDDRGIDVGLMTRRKHVLESFVSHVDDRGANRERIFSRDCAMYEIITPSGKEVLVLVNHFKSRMGGGDAKRLAQAKQVRKIYRQLRAEGHTRIAVVGDLNDHPHSEALKPLLPHTDLRDISEHPNFDDGAAGTRPGTFGSGTARDKIDYVLLSPALFRAATGGGIFRHGVWAGEGGSVFERYGEVRSASHAASDHAPIWADIDV
jgi:endonuclease/exonuclease/phosphatase family metal-dependent hydrolase